MAEVPESIETDEDRKVSSTKSQLTASRRAFIKGGIAAGLGAAAVYVGPRFTTVFVRPAYASITGPSATPTPTTEPFPTEVPIMAADMYVLQGPPSSNDGPYTIAAHIPVPNENNRAGVPLSQCLRESGRANEEPIVRWLDATRRAEISNGEIVERVWQQQFFDSQDFNDIVNNLLPTEYASRLAGFQNQLRQEFHMWRTESDA